MTSATRVPTANEIPTLAEAGVPGYEAVAWLMVVTRAGLPPDILNKLHGELKAILAQPEIREQIARFGMIPVDSPPPEELHRYVGSETARWSRIVQRPAPPGSSSRLAGHSKTGQLRAKLKSRAKAPCGREQQ